MRLAARGRASDGDIAQRIGRAAPADAELSPDHVIENVGDLERGTASLVAAISGRPEAAEQCEARWQSATAPLRHVAGGIRCAIPPYGPCHKGS